MTVFVPRTAPGDRVRLRNVRRHRRHAEAQIASVVEPGPARVSPPCNHFVSDGCGGCQWQHLSAVAQHDAKRRIVGDALRRVGKLDIADPELVSSPRALHYRTTITLTVRWRGAHPLVGFHDGADPDRVFMLEGCSIAREELGALWIAMRPALTALPKGDDVRLKLRVLPDGSRHVMVDGGDGAWTGAARLSQAAGSDVTIWWQPTGGASRRMAGADADPSSVAFEQVNAEVAALLREAVIEAAAGGRADGRTSGPTPRLLDLYAGSGDTAVPLARRGFDVAMVEQDPRSVRRAEDCAKVAGVSVRCIAGQVENHIEKLLPADVVIVNPPRAGLSPEVADRLSARPPVRFVYVSCDPATLARDLTRLRITAADVLSLRAYDMFPQTSHVEMLLVARAGSGA
ncbi:MAG: class I SAM-dependent RNA methyltransferase [Gemmatimonadales bacterium]